jgi:hypothetical protein
MEAIRPAVLPNPQPRRASEAASSGEFEGSLVVFNLYYSRMKNLPQIAPWKDVLTLRAIILSA